MKRKSTYKQIVAALFGTALLVSCSHNDSSQPETVSKIGNKDISTVIKETVSFQKEDYYSDWKNENPTYVALKGSTADVDNSDAVFVSDGRITIKTGGVYVFSGTLDNGQIVVDAENQGLVRIVLNGADITSLNNAPIYVKEAEKTVISLEAGTKNTLADGEDYGVSADNEPYGALNSKDDLTINGTGQLIVHANFNNGITSKDELKITGGTINIDAVDDGLMGRDVVAVKDGNFTIKAGGDGVKSSNDDNDSKGDIAIEGGTFTITAAGDGMQAAGSLLIADGKYTITSGGGSPETIAARNEGFGGPFGGQPPGSTENEVEDTPSAKGLKAASEIAVGGGSFTIDSSDDAVHSDNSVTIAGGALKLATGDDGVHGDSSVLVKGGSIDITKSYEGIESMVITISDGDIHLVAVDDGINVGGGADSSGGGNMFAADEGVMLTINGGYVVVDAGGDGLDSNGSVGMTGGTVLVNGPTENMNAPLDYNGTFDMTGGFLIAAGSAGMAQAVSDTSKQYSLLMTYPETQTAGTVVHLEDSEGNTIATFAPAKDYQSVFISSPKLQKDSTYRLYSGGSSTGNEADGLYNNEAYSGGTKIVEFTISDSVTWLNESGVTTGGQSGPGGFGPGQGGRGGGVGGQTQPSQGNAP